jgi:hypothetical protein
MDHRYVPAAWLAGAACACVGITLANPGDDGIPICPTKALLGLDCPLCGGLRVISSLGHGRFADALDHNVLVVALLPFVAVFFVAYAIAAWRERPPPRIVLPEWGWIMVAVGLVAFSVVRNLTGNPVGRYLNSSLS